MKLRLLAGLLLACTAMATQAAGIRNVTDPDAPRALVAQGPVEVSWTDPSQFSDIRYSGNRAAAQRGNWVSQLAEYLRDRAGKRLQPGERLDVRITDIKRAGNYEPWRGIAFNDVRVVKDIYPPRLELQFKRIGSDGRVIAQGERKLTDPGFMMGSTNALDSDPLRYEKHMIDRWLLRELGKPDA